MESQSQNPEFRNNPENLRPKACKYDFARPKASISLGCEQFATISRLI